MLWIFAVDKKNNLWIATFGGGLNRAVIQNHPDSSGNSIKNRNVRFEHYKQNKNNRTSLSDNKIITLFEDKDETLWIGTYDGGLNKLDFKNKTLPSDEASFTSYIANGRSSDCICNNKVMAISQDNDGYIWIGTFGGGIDKLDIQSETFTHYYHDPANHKSLPDNDILSLYVDRSGILWIGSHLGKGVTNLQKNIAKFNLINKDSGEKPILNDDVVWSVYEDSKNNLWVGMYRGGLNFINSKTNRTIAYQFNEENNNSISDNHIRSIKEDNFNNLWVGTYSGGLNRFNLKTGKIDRFKNDPENSNSLSANQVQDILIESDYCNLGGYFWRRA